MNHLAPHSSTRHWAIRLIVAFVLCGITACIIGPKQDDPETASLEQDSGAPDTGEMGAADTGKSDPADVATTPGDETSTFSDSATSGADGAPKTDAACGDSGDAGDAACDSGGADAVGGG